MQLNDPTLPANHPVNKLDPIFFTKNRPGQFAPKLLFKERCAVLAFHLSGVSRYLLAHAFGINRRTVGHICNPDARYYNDVRRELSKLGEVEFKKTYITEGMQRKIALLKNDPEVKMSYRTYDKAIEKKPDMRARSHEGNQIVEMHGATYRIMIAWRDHERYGDIDTGPGWYWRNLDDDDESFYPAGDNGKPGVTSKQAYTWVAFNI